ncbi:unnamed protein product [Adineta steineri]|uniref:Uncharacterized protein n=1 Tax=Adineta steineri TaxID=433720 RepID=A0A813MYQ3_9BILA|nr:unnamed protein product [Adineta steineri]
MAVEDVNGDGFNDIITANSTGNSIIILLNSSDGTSYRQTVYPSPNGAGFLVAADINNDKKVDFIVGNQFRNNIGLFLNNGDDTFKTETIGTGAPAQDVVVTDINEDGRNDIIVVYSTNKVGVFF